MAIEHRWAVVIATGEFLYGTRADSAESQPDVVPGLSPGQMRVVISAQPDKRLDRYDAGSWTQRRDATPQEIDAWDRARVAEASDAVFDASDFAMIRALAGVVGDLATPTKTSDQMKELIKTKRKTLT